MFHMCIALDFKFQYVTCKLSVLPIFIHGKVHLGGGFLSIMFTIHLKNKKKKKDSFCLLALFFFFLTS